MLFSLFYLFSLFCDYSILLVRVDNPMRDDLGVVRSEIFEGAIRSSLDNIWPRRFEERSIMLSRVKLTNAHTVRGRPTLKNNTECFRNGLVRELKEKQTNENALSSVEARLLGDEFRCRC